MGPLVKLATVYVKKSP